MKSPITTAIVVAHAHCRRKAFLMLSGAESGSPHEYGQVLAAQAEANQTRYLAKLAQAQTDVVAYTAAGLANKHQFLTAAILKTERFTAECGLLTKVASHSALGHYSYEPTLFVGTHTISKEQKLALFFTGRVLEVLQTKAPVASRIIDVTGKTHTINLAESTQALLPVLEPLHEWMADDSPAEPPVILNKHCPLCQFRDACRSKAEQENNLSLLDRMTPKIIRQYERKGIFTVTQLSYTFRPRKRKKRAKNPPPVTHKLELQALAIREKKIYLQELPAITRQPTELFLDIEGIPDQNAYYLFGLLVCEGETSRHHAFWADTLADEARIWQQFVDKANEYPDALIYHYGNYEAKALKKLAQRYATDAEPLLKRLVNVNGFIYGKVYFPIYSNRLKEIGQFIGATWSSPEASGLQSLVWRHWWEETKEADNHRLLVRYNQEDCIALKLLTDRLAGLIEAANILSDDDLVNQNKQLSPELSQGVSRQFEEILKFAHFDYDKKKINFRQSSPQQKSYDKTDVQRRNGKQQQEKVIVIRQKTKKAVEIPFDGICPKCGFEPLKKTNSVSRRYIVDLNLTSSGLKKTFTQYYSFQGYCQKCQKQYAPTQFRRYPTGQIYGHGISAWVVYHRVALHLPYESIAESLFEQFKEKISSSLPITFLKRLATYYSETEKTAINHLVSSPFVHVDETKVNIRGSNWYVWVFTNEQYAVFKLQETREATIVHEFLDKYKGVLISDFYPGYDSVECKQQKCWVHLIRDLNDDLIANPLDTEYESFVAQVRNLIVPIMETIQKYGQRKRNLNKFRRVVDNFYDRVIVDKPYRSDVVLKYQKRFVRYRESLFTFLEEDGIPWHNNTAERAIRPFARQRDATRSPLHDSATHNYLLLLGIHQTCRFQGKSFFKFLFSGETDLDEFQKSKRSRKSPS